MFHLNAYFSQSKNPRVLLSVAAGKGRWKRSPDDMEFTSWNEICFESTKTAESVEWQDPD